MKTRVVSATEFKAKCLAMLDEIEEGGTAITVTRRGKPVATLGPVAKTAELNFPMNSWAGKMRIVGDIVNTDFEWDCVSKK